MATPATVPHPQQNPAVVVPIAPFPRRIAQEELQEVLLLRRKAETLEALEADLKQRLQAGATVEDGVHIARLKPGSRRNVAWREVAERLGDRLYGDGKGRAVLRKSPRLDKADANRLLSRRVKPKRRRGRSGSRWRRAAFVCASPAAP